MPEKLDINFRIARRVSELRAAQGLSLDALAGQCDVSRSTLSLIERGESNATAVVLEKMAAGLGVSLASLFDDFSSEGGPIVRKNDRDSWQDPASGYTRRNISPPNFPSPIQIVDVNLPAGASVTYESNLQHFKANIHEQIWILSGKLDVTIGDTVHHLAEDDCLAFHLNQTTSFRNPSNNTNHYLVIISNQNFFNVRRDSTR